MEEFEEIQSGETSKEEFQKRGWAKQNPKPRTVNQKEVPEDLEIPEEYIPEEDEFEQQKKGTLLPKDMMQAEQEVTHRQMVEYKESTEPTPESQAEMDNKLLQVAARMSVRKELIEARAPDGTIRNVSIPIEEEYPEIFTEDLIKGNYGQDECACIFGNGSLINSMKSIGQAKNFPLVEAARFNKNQMALMINLSRGRNGFSAILVKTDKHVSEGVVNHVQRAYTEKKEKRWGFI